MSGLYAFNTQNDILERIKYTRMHIYIAADEMMTGHEI